MKTDMERYKMVENARQGIITDIPTDFNNLLHRLLAVDVNHRPTTAELKKIVQSMLKNEQNHEHSKALISDLRRQLSEQTEEIENLRQLQIQGPTSIHIELQNEIEQKNKEIEIKRKEMQNKDKEIESLKKKILQLESQNS
jgi:polyhydroxyalkanoate synthesis regulator phasin